MAVGIELRDAVNAFRHLPVALAQFGASYAAGGLDVVVADETELAAALGPYFQFHFLFQCDKDDFAWRIGHLGLGEIGGEFPRRGAV